MVHTLFLVLLLIASSCSLYIGLLLNEPPDSIERIAQTTKRIWLMAVAVLVCALVQFAITSTVIALPNGRPLTFRWLEATNIYDLEGEAKRIGNQWGFVARESTDGKQYGDAKFYATELKPPEKFQPIYIEGELHFNPVGDIVLPDDADDLTNRIMHAMPLVEETSE